MDCVLTARFTRTNISMRKRLWRLLAIVAITAGYLHNKVWRWGAT